jgi:UDP-3-O-acyl-N-acetylglucosamine deacetylase
MKTTPEGIKKPEYFGEIKIPRLVLKESVTIQGKDGKEATDVFGRKSKLTLHPHFEPGWFWKVNGEIVPIKMNMLKYGMHFLYLEHNGKRINVVEHLLPLRFLGLDSVVIEQEGSSFIPYEGGANNFWEAVEPKLKYDGYLTPVKKQIQAKVVYEGKLRRKVAVDNSIVLDKDGTKILPSDLVVTSHVDYKHLGGSFKLEKIFPNISPDFLKELVNSRPAGRGHLQQKLLGYAGRFLNWPHVGKQNILDDKTRDPEEILREVATHRMLDFLGAMALIPDPGEYLLGTLFSSCGNHQIDVELNDLVAKRFG